MKCALRRVKSSKGTEITAYINGDIPLDPIKFATKPVNETLTPSTAASAAPPHNPTAVSPAQDPAPVSPVVVSERTTVTIKSTPDGADITVDGKYVGSTPSTLRLVPGDHTISVEKSGFKPWQRTITVGDGGAITVDATLIVAVN